MKCRVFKDFFSKAVLVVQLGAQGCKLWPHVLRAHICVLPPVASHQGAKG